MGGVPKERNPEFETFEPSTCSCCAAAAVAAEEARWRCCSFPIIGRRATKRTDPTCRQFSQRCALAPTGLLYLLSLLYSKSFFTTAFLELLLSKFSIHSKHNFVRINTLIYTFTHNLFVSSRLINRQLAASFVICLFAISPLDRCAEAVLKPAPCRAHSLSRRIKTTATVRSRSGRSLISSKRVSKPKRPTQQQPQSQSKQVKINNILSVN